MLGDNIVTQSPSHTNTIVRTCDLPPLTDVAIGKSLTFTSTAAECISTIEFLFLDLVKFLSLFNQVVEVAVDSVSRRKINLYSLAKNINPQ